MCARLSVMPVLALLSCALIGGCGRGAGGGRAPDAAAPYARDWAAHPAVVTLAAPAEIDVVGDLHGDPDVAFRLLAAAGLMGTSPALHWTGGARLLIITGDVIDKGASALPIIAALRTLAPQAEAVGGRIVVTLGNHEAEFLADPTGSKTEVFQQELRAAGLDPARVAAGEGEVGAWLRDLPVAAAVGDWFFCHAGDSDGRSAVAIAQKFRESVQGAKGYGDGFLVGDGSLLEANDWWSAGNPASPTEVVDANLAALPARHVVFGHDPGPLSFPGDPRGDRARGEMAARYDGRLFLIDVGMSYAVDYEVGSLLRIVTGSPGSAAKVDVGGQVSALWP